MEKDPFIEYIKQDELSKKEKASVWSVAIGLQAVDGLKPSKYLIETAVRNVEGDITLEEVQDFVHSYYEENPRNDQDDRMEEADKVSIRIVEILSQIAFSFTIKEYISIHKQLFEGIYPHAGRLRDYNITKKEWVLDGDTVIYGSAAQLYETLEYDLLVERRFTYKGLDMTDIIHHLAQFISNLWQIHIFEEGNTRTTAVFLIKYLRMLGFDVTNQIFAEHAWYFRNSLVRANYKNLKENIYESTEYLEYFLRNFLLGEENALHNSELHVKYISGKENIAL